MPQRAGARSDLLKMAYAVMLCEFAGATVSGFWERHRLCRGGRTYSTKETLAFLWDHRNRVPLRYLLTTLAGIDAFLGGLPADERERFTRRFLDISNAMPLVPSVFLTFVAPLLHVFFRFSDPRYALCSRIVGENQRFMMPGTSFRYVDRTKTRAGFSGYAIISYDPSFSRNYPAIDVWRWVVFFLANGCPSVGLPPIDRLAVRADMRPFEAVHAVRGGTAGGGREVPGRRMSFRAYCAEWGFAMGDLRPPDTEVLVAEIDDRGDLATGGRGGTPCAFAAPLYLIDIQCRAVPRSRIPENPMQKVVALGAETGARSWAHLETLHRQFVETLRDEYIVRYDPDRSVLQVNGRTVARRVTAALIAGLVRLHCTKGQTLFGRREILALPELRGRVSEGTYNVYVQRACRYLARHAPNLRLARNIGEGTVELHADAEMRFECRNARDVAEAPGTE